MLADGQQLAIVEVKAAAECLQSVWPEGYFVGGKSGRHGAAKQRGKNECAHDFS
jgi:hypothetical protein